MTFTSLVSPENNTEEKEQRRYVIGIIIIRKKTRTLVLKNTETNWKKV